MRIASFNINNINRRLPSLLEWLRETEPDVVSLQELKATDAEFPANAIQEAGYKAVWRGQKSWNGVAILARWAPILTCGALPGDPADAQSRYIEAAVNGVLVTSLYAPNGNPQPGPKFGYKLAWLKRLAAHAADLYAHPLHANFEIHGYLCDRCGPIKSLVVLRSPPLAPTTGPKRPGVGYSESGHVRKPHCLGGR